MPQIPRSLALSLLLLAATIGVAQAETVQRATCAAIPGRGYTGGCGELENRAIFLDAPEANFSDRGTACQAARNAITEQLTAKLRSADRLRPGNYHFCSALTIRCQPTCGRVEK